MNAGAEEGGGPAGVVEGLEIKVFDFEGWPLAIRDRESGVDGGEDENGTTKPDMVEGICVDVPADGHKKECVEKLSFYTLANHELTWETRQDCQEIENRRNIGPLRALFISPPSLGLLLTRNHHLAPANP